MKEAAIDQLTAGIINAAKKTINPTKKKSESTSAAPRTTVLIPKDLHRELRLESYMLDKSLAEYVTEILISRKKVKT